MLPFHRRFGVVSCPKQPVGKLKLVFKLEALAIEFFEVNCVVDLVFAIAIFFCDKLMLV